jgi:hypothetical protein
MSTYRSRRDAIDLLDVAAVLGFLISLGIGILFGYDGPRILLTASSYLAICFFSSIFLCEMWRIPRSPE